MREIVDHYFPPVGLLVKGGGEEFTDFNYWRRPPLGIEDFTDSESEDDDDDDGEAGPVIENALQRFDTLAGKESVLSEDEAGIEDSILLDGDGRPSLEESLLSESSIFDDEEEVEAEEIQRSMLQKDGDGDGDDELEVENEEEEEVEQGVVSPPRTPERPAAECFGDREGATPRRSEDLLPVGGKTW